MTIFATLGQLEWEERMPSSKSQTGFAGGAGTAIVALLAMLLLGCKNNSTRPADAAVDAPQGSTSTSAGTGSAILTGTASGPGSNNDIGGRTLGASSTMTSSASLTSTARDTATGTGSASTVAASATATGTATAKVPDGTSFTVMMTGNLTGITTGTMVMTATATPTSTVRTISSGTMVYTDIVATTNTTTKTTTFICYPTTAAPTATSTGVTTGTGRAVCATWNTITVFRRNGLGFCPVADTASSVTIKRADDGSLVLGGKAFRADAAGTSGCVSTSAGVCLVTQAIPQTTLTPAQSEQLMSLLSAMPPGSCPHNGACDPCLITTLTVDDNSEADWEGCCTDPSGPGTHRAGYRAVVAFIDRLLPATAPSKADASADGSPALP
jgi:hypothetical protein